MLVVNNKTKLLEAFSSRERTITVTGKLAEDIFYKIYDMRAYNEYKSELDENHAIPHGYAKWIETLEMCFPEDKFPSEGENVLIPERVNKTKKELSNDEIIKEILPYYMISYFKNGNLSDLDIEIMRDTISNDNDYELRLICWAKRKK